MVKWVLKYVRYTLNYEVYYIGYTTVLERYNDVNWISNTKDLRSISGYVFILAGAAVLWKYYKQRCIVKPR